MLLLSINNLMLIKFRITAASGQLLLESRLFACKCCLIVRQCLTHMMFGSQPGLQASQGIEMTDLQIRLSAKHRVSNGGCCAGLYII